MNHFVIFFLWTWLWNVLKLGSLQGPSQCLFRQRKLNVIGNSRSDKKKDKERKSNLSNTFSKSFLITFISDCGKIFSLSFINGEVGVCCISDMMMILYLFLKNFTIYRHILLFVHKLNHCLNVKEMLLKLKIEDLHHLLHSGDCVPGIGSCLRPKADKVLTQILK